MHIFFFQPFFNGFLVTILDKVSSVISSAECKNPLANATGVSREGCPTKSISSFCEARLSSQFNVHTNISANSFENGGMLFAELFSVKGKESLEWHAVLLGRVSCKKTSYKPVEFVPPGGSFVCSFKKTCNTFMAIFVE